MQAVIVSFDSLAANSLGCYGNEWIETPNLDCLAATGVVFDRHFADTVGSKAGMGWVLGQHALSPLSSVAPVPMGRRLKSKGVLTKLITASDFQNWQRIAEFDEHLTVTAREGVEVHPDEVPIAQVVKAGLAALRDLAYQTVDRLLWLHSPGPRIPPSGFDSLYFEDFEERGQQVAELSDEERASHPAVYAGAVSLVDHWLGELLNEIEASANAQPTLVIVTAAVGYLWHQVKSSKMDSAQSSNRSLCDQMIRTPLLIKVIGNDQFKEFGSLRSNRLVQCCDLAPTLFDWFGGASADGNQSFMGQSWLKELTEESTSRASLWVGDENNFEAVRTNDWLCVRDNSDVMPVETASLNEPIQISLFAKPENIWDVNDIASQQPEVVAELLHRLLTTKS